MTWNHRVVKKTYPSGEESYGIHEVFYNEKGEIYAYTENPIDLACETLDSLKEYIQWCMSCLDKPILIDGEVSFAKDELSEEEISEMKETLTKEEFEEEMRFWNEKKDNEGNN